MKIDTKNMIVLNGMVFTLVTKEEVYTNEPENYVCKLCELRSTCNKFAGLLCDVQDAQPNQFYIFIDRIEVVSMQLVSEIIGSYEENMDRDIIKKEIKRKIKNLGEQRDVLLEELLVYIDSLPQHPAK